MNILITCVTCKHWEHNGKQGVCAVIEQPTSPGFQCSRWKQNLEPKCGTCFGVRQIYLDRVWQPCPTCDPNGLDYKEWNLSKDITPEMRKAHWALVQRISEMAAAVPKKENYNTPDNLKKFGIHCCENCGLHNPVERSHCKQCDSLLHFKQQ